MLSPGNANTVSILEGIDDVCNLDNRTFARLPLFVYGTLLRGELRGVHLERYRSTPASIRGTLYDTGPYPACTAVQPLASDSPGRGEGWVHGELVEAPTQLLAELDAIEGVDHQAPWRSLFRRTRVRARVAWPHDTLAWVYTYNRDPEGLAAIAGGAWRGRTLPRGGDALVDKFLRVAAEVEGLDDRSVRNWDPTLPGEAAWGGAEVIVCDGDPPPLGLDAWGAPPRVYFAITPHARALAWLFQRLGDEVYPTLYVHKYQFYREVSEAVVRVGTAGQRTALRAALDTAMALCGL